MSVSHKNNSRGGLEGKFVGLAKIRWRGTMTNTAAFGT